MMVRVHIHRDLFWRDNEDCLNDTDGDGVCDELEVLGCTDAIACNYNASATDDDGSCTYPSGDLFRL